MTMKKEKVARFRVKKIKVLSIRKITREYQLFIISWKITKIWEKKRRRRKAKKSLDVEISSVSIPTYAQNTSFSTQNFLSLRN